MTGKSKNLPNEIFDIIFQYLAQKNLMDCRMVCRLWYHHATCYLINHVSFYNKKKIFKFLNYQSSIENSMKILDTPFEYMKDSHLEENIKQLMIKVPNIQEFELYDDLILLSHLNGAELPISLTSIIISFDFLHINQDLRGFLNFLARLRGRLQRLKITAYTRNYNIFKKGYMGAFLGSFPKLTELDVGGVLSIRCLEDCLKIILAIPSLKSIVFGNDRFDIDTGIKSKIQFKQNTLEKISFTAYNFLPGTLLFIIRNFVNLKEINTTFNRIIHSYDYRYSTVLFEFLNFIYTKDTYDFGFKVTNSFYQTYLSKNILNSFIQLPENNQYVSKHLHVIVEYPNNQEVKYMHHSFRLKSDRDYCYRLQRILQWKFVFIVPYVSKFFDQYILPSTKDVDILTFDMVNDPRSYCFDYFFDLLSLLKKPKKVVLIISHNLKFQRYTFHKFSSITLLEIQVTNILEENLAVDYEGLPLSLNIFPNLKTLRLVHWCGTWDPVRKTCSLLLPLQNLESLHLDITSYVSITKDFGIECFRLIVETKATLHLYEVSTTSLYAVNILQLDSELLQKSYRSQLYIQIQNINNLHLYTMTKDFKSYSDSRSSLSSSSCEMESLILF